MTRRFDTWAIYGLAGWSGYFVMAIELLAARALAPIFGSGLYVWGAVVTTFMFALSVGYLLGGHLSQRAPRLNTMGVLLLLTATTAILSALGTDVITQGIADRMDDVRYGALCSALTLYFWPIAISGAISPCAIRLLSESRGSSGSVAGKVFFVSTLGSVLGTLATSFYLVAVFDLTQLIIGMSVLCGTFGMTAVVISKN